MPALIGHAQDLSAGYRRDIADLDNALLTGFVEALRRGAGLDLPAPYAKLIAAAHRAGIALRKQADREFVDPEPHTHAGPRAPKRPFNHEDLMVKRAVELGILDRDDEEPWIDVKLAGRPVEMYAVILGISEDTLRQRLDRATKVLGEAAKDGLLTGPVSPTVMVKWRAYADRRAKIRAARTGVPSGIATRMISAMPPASTHA